MSGISQGAVMRTAFGVVAVVMGSGVAEAWPARGPVARAERRVFRAQMALERELARPLGRVRVIEVPVYPMYPGGPPAAAALLPPGAAPPPGALSPPDAVLPPAVSATPRMTPAPAHVLAPAPETLPAVDPLPEPRAVPAASAPRMERGVAPAGFEAPLPQRPGATPQPVPPTEPAADGTVSVLVRPDAAPAGKTPAQERPTEPLEFPGASQP